MVGQGRKGIIIKAKCGNSYLKSCQTVRKGESNILKTFDLSCGFLCLGAFFIPLQNESEVLDF